MHKTTKRFFRTAAVLCLAVFLLLGTAFAELIIVVTYEEDITILDLMPDETFFEVKEKIASDTGIPASRQRLFLGETEVCDDELLADYWSWLVQYPLIEVRDGYVAPPPTGDGSVCLLLAALVLSGAGLVVLKKPSRKASL